MNLKLYIKRAIKYILYEHKPTSVKIDIKQLDNSYILKDKVVLITGGSDGIGLSIAKRFDETGAKVIITGRRENKLKKAISDMKSASYYVNDVSLISEQDDLLKNIYDKYGKIDILINNAGISNHEEDYLMVTEDSFNSQFDINLKGAYFLTQKIIKKALNKKNELNIIFISSERGSQCDFLPYGLTKIAINSLVEALACRFIKEGIRVNGIAPGVTVSNMFKVDNLEDLSTDYYNSGRIFKSEEVSEIALFLASDYSKCISGEIIHTNNGNHLNKWF